MRGCCSLLGVNDTEAGTAGSGLEGCCGAESSVRRGVDGYERSKHARARQTSNEIQMHE